MTAVGWRSIVSDVVGAGRVDPVRVSALTLGELFGQGGESGDQAVSLLGGESVERAAEVVCAVEESLIDGAFLAFGDRDDGAPSVRGVFAPFEESGLFEFDGGEACRFELDALASGELGDGHRSVERDGQ